MIPRFKLLLVYTTVFVLLFLLEETIRLKHTGFEEKTLWDWMELLIIPIVLAIGAFLLDRSERTVERQIAKQRTAKDRKLAKARAKLDREIALDRQQEEALQVYLDRMAHLLIEKNLRAAENEEVRNVARTRTMTVLRGLDAKRKGLVLKFLYEADLISKDKIIVDLRANTRSIDGITAMSKPSLNIKSCNRQQGLFEGVDQIGQGSGLESAQDGLDLRPGQFNRVKVRRVRRQIDQVSTMRADQLFQPCDLVSGEVVHEQNITGLKGREHTLFDIAIKHGAIDRAGQHQRRRDPCPTNHGQRGGLRSGGLWHTVDHALTWSGSPIQACQVDIEAGFIEKFEVLHIQLCYGFPKLAALALDLRRVPLAGMERLFFRGSFSRTNSRCIILGADLIFVSFSTASHNSCNVTSGCALTAARMAASAVASLRAGPPACGNGAQLPVFRYWANQRSIDGSLTLYRRAASGILLSPLSTLAITRSRRSVE